MKIYHSGDWHIGNFKGPEKEGVNLRSLDTRRCLEFMAERAEQERPGLVLVPGDIFHAGKTWSDRCCDEVVMAIDIITRLAATAGQVVVMRGTPNHDGIGPFKVLKTYFDSIENVHIVVNPEVIQTEYADIAVLPGFDRGVYRAKFPGLGKEEENEVFSVVCQLPQNYKTVIYLSYYEGYKVKEIASLMKTREGTVKTWLFRAREILREKLEGGFENE